MILGWHRVDGSMELSVTTGRRGLRSRSKPTRSPIAELTRRTIGRPDLEEGRCERKLPSTLSLPKSASAGGLGQGFPWARYYDLAHGNPISDIHIEHDLRGGLEGCSPSISAQPNGQGRGAATDDAQQSRPLGGLRRSPAGHVLSVAKV